MSATVEATRASGRDLSGRRALDDALFGVVPALLTAWVLYKVATGGIVAVDFRHSFWVAAHRFLLGGNPYAWSRSQILSGTSYPYPATTTILLAPLALLPSLVASGVATGACLLAPLAALRVLEIGDRRLYGVVLLWMPVVLGWQSANMSLPLAFGLAVLWRKRNAPGWAGALTALLVLVKPIMLPLGLWLLATRRYRAGLIAVASGIAASAVSWSLAGWDSLPRWLELVSRQGSLLDRRGYGAIALLWHLGLSQAAAMGVTLALAALLAGALVRAGRQGLEAAAFALAVTLTIVASPQVDLHYFALLAIPLALAVPRLSAVWLLPLVLWACPSMMLVATWRQLLWWLVVAAVATRTAISR